MNFIKTVSVMLAAVLLAGTLAGCGEDSERGGRSSKAENFTAISGKNDSEELFRGKLNTVSVSNDFIMGIKNDGTVYVIGGNSSVNNRSVDSWDDVIAVSVGSNHLVGLRSNGTVVATGKNTKRQCEVYEWTDIVAVHGGLNRTFGLKSDGTVVATTENGTYTIEGWENIVSITGIGDNLWGLSENGDVYTVSKKQPVYSGVKSIHSNVSYAIFILEDGTVAADLQSEDYAYRYEGIEEWSDIVDVSTRTVNHAVGLRSDGTVVSVGDNCDGRCDVSEWSDIVAVATGSYHTVGLKADGTVVATGGNGYGQCDVSEWRDIVAIYADNIVTVGLRADGRVLACGSIWEGFDGIENFTDIKTKQP